MRNSRGIKGGRNNDGGGMGGGSPWSNDDSKSKLTSKIENILKKFVFFFISALERWSWRWWNER